MNLLNGLFLKDPFSLFIDHLVMFYAGRDWSIYVFIFTVILFLSLMLFHRNIQEYPVHAEGQQFETVCEYVQDKFHNMSVTLCDPKRAQHFANSLSLLHSTIAYCCGSLLLH